MHAGGLTWSRRVLGCGSVRRVCQTKQSGHKYVSESTIEQISRGSVNCANPQHRPIQRVHVSHYSPHTISTNMGTNKQPQQDDRWVSYRQRMK